MTNIFIVRHGQDEDNAAGILNGHRDMPLTEKGRQQAQLVAQKLRDDSIDAILSSPLKRTMQTANIIAKELGIYPVHSEDLLIERDFGILSGHPYSDIPKLASATLQGDGVLFFLEGEGVETFEKARARAEQLLALVEQRHNNQHVLLVTHGDIGIMIRAAYHNWPMEQALLAPYPANTGVLELTAGQEEIA